MCARHLCSAAFGLQNIMFYSIILLSVWCSAKCCAHKYICIIVVNDKCIGPHLLTDYNLFCFPLTLSLNGKHFSSIKADRARNDTTKICIECMFVLCVYRVRVCGACMYTCMCVHRFTLHTISVFSTILTIKNCFLKTSRLLLSKFELTFHNSFRFVNVHYTIFRKALIITLF